MSYYLAIKNDTPILQISMPFYIKKTLDCPIYVQTAVQFFFGTLSNVNIITTLHKGNTSQEFIDQMFDAIFLKSMCINKTELGKLVFEAAIKKWKVCFWWASDGGNEFKNIKYSSNPKCFLNMMKLEMTNGNSVVKTLMGNFNYNQDR